MEKIKKFFAKISNKIKEYLDVDFPTENEPASTGIIDRTPQIEKDYYGSAASGLSGYKVGINTQQAIKNAAGRGKPNKGEITRGNS